MLRTGKAQQYGREASPGREHIALFVRSNSYRHAPLAKLSELTPKTISA
jgi:hypothetical protein